MTLPVRFHGSPFGLLLRSEHSGDGCLDLGVVCLALENGLDFDDLIGRETELFRQVGQAFFRIARPFFAAFSEMTFWSEVAAVAFLAMKSRGVGSGRWCRGLCMKRRLNDQSDRRQTSGDEE